MLFVSSLWDRLPFEVSLSSRPGARRRSIVGLLCGAVILAVSLIVPAVQYQTELAKYQHKWHDFQAAYGGHPPENIAWPARSRGVLSRWSRAVEKFWQGRNIYLSYTAHQEGTPRGTGLEASDPGPGGEIWLHPNMPFTVILLTPFACLPASLGAAIWNVLKILTFLASLWMVADNLNHKGDKGHEVSGKGTGRIPAWLLGLAVLSCLPPVILDLQHGNTNLFVLGAIVLHLWLFRRGRDVAAGAALALAICLKMTPAIFLLYWLYQRNWRLLASAAAAMLLALTVIPMLACVGIAGGLEGGIAHWRMLTGTWLNDVILPGLLRGATYPTHINQSLTGLLDRLFLAGSDGNIFYSPDDYRYADQTKFGWITLVKLTPQTVRWIVRAAQVAVVGLMAWAIGWRKLDRDDPRRMVHWSLVVLAMLILNQRTWDHHAAVLLIPAMGIWWAVFRGAGIPERGPLSWPQGCPTSNSAERQASLLPQGLDSGPDSVKACRSALFAVGKARFSRRVAIALMIGAGVLLWSIGSDPFVIAATLTGHDKDVGRAWADWYKACGPTFWSFVLMFAAGVILARRARGGGSKTRPPD